MSAYIVTVTSPDRVGIVHAVTGAIRDQGGNILELSQTVLRGYFTVILAVEFAGPCDRYELRSAIAERGRRFDLHVAIIEAQEGADVPPVPNGERFVLTVLGADGVGAVHGIAGCLAARGVNIVDLHARAEGGRFSLVMEAFLPPDLAPGVLKADLEAFGRHLGLEAYVQHENIFVATNEAHPVRVGAAPGPEGAAGVPH